jgi:hypothetical protein
LPYELIDTIAVKRQNVRIVMEFPMRMRSCGALPATAGFTWSGIRSGRAER